MARFLLFFQPGGVAEHLIHEFRMPALRFRKGVALSLSTDRPVVGLTGGRILRVPVLAAGERELFRFGENCTPLRPLVHDAEL